MLSYGELVDKSPTNHCNAVYNTLSEPAQHHAIHSRTFHRRFSNQNNFIADVVQEVSPPVAHEIELLNHVDFLDHEVVFQFQIVACEFGFQYFIIYKAEIYIL